MSLPTARPPGASDSTIIKPQGAPRRAPVLSIKGGRGKRPEVEGLQLAPAAVLGVRGVPPLVSAALPLLNVTARLRDSTEAPDLEGLRSRMIGAVKLFEQRSLGSGVPTERGRAAHYALCATVDDVVLNSPWGNYSVWARQSMVSTFHQDVTGGERFFDLLSHLHKDPGTNRDVLLLMYMCLSIGFEGRMRVHPQGHLEIGRIREGLYRTLRGDVERELSPAWRGVDARHRPLSTPLVLWTAAALAALALMGTWFGLGGALDRRSDVTFTALLAAPPRGTPSLQRGAPQPPATPAAAAAAAAATAVEPSLGPLQAAFAPEIGEGLLGLTKTDLGTLIRLRNKGLFATGSAAVSAEFAGLIDRIGRTLKGQVSQLAVVGYTDDVPIRTARFPSNYELSVARADAVGKLLGQQIDPAIIRSEGRGATEPLAPNGTADGREQNRRTEITVVDRRGAPQP